MMKSLIIIGLLMLLVGCSSQIYYRYDINCVETIVEYYCQETNCEVHAVNEFELRLFNHNSGQYVDVEGLRQMLSTCEVS